MSRGFYAKMAFLNIRKNAKTFLPYILTCIGCIAMFYIINALSRNSGLGDTTGASALLPILSFGSFVVGLFSVIFLFYTNSFLVKRRKKEFGLYNILGMEKKHIARVMLLETLFVAVFSLVTGLIIGVLLNKLCVLFILKLIGIDTVMGFEVSIPAMITAAVLFLCIFLLNFLSNIRQIQKAKPIDLLKGGQVGEREPKTKWILAVVGVLTLGAGYYLSITTADPMSALGNFFIAVILVIIGTYCLFTAGSIAVLKMMRKNKSYYYKTKHFISVSGMIYRMKRNAVGLANICILSTAVLVTVSTTTSMYIGTNDIMEAQYPRDILINSYEWQDAAALKQKADEVSDQSGAERENEISYTYLSFAGIENNGAIETTRDYADAQVTQVFMGKLRNLYFIPLDDYNRVTGRQEELAKDEVLIYSNRTEYQEDTMKLFDMQFTVKERLEGFPKDMEIDVTSIIVSSHYIIVKDMDMIEKLDEEQKKAYGSNSSSIKYVYGFDVDMEDEDAILLANNLREQIVDEDFEGKISCQSQEKTSLYSLYGGMFFVGIFLGILFIMATVLIIYYKQMSEGYDDKERFEIMQKVGLSKSEVKKTIHAQVLTVFFLPLITAGIHIAAAFPLISKLLSVLSLNNTGLFIWCTLICLAVFALFYGVIYSLTARTYYKIVSAK